MGIESLKGNVKILSGAGNKGRYKKDFGLYDMELDNAFFNNGVIDIGEPLINRNPADAKLANSAYQTSANARPQKIGNSEYYVFYDAPTKNLPIFKTVNGEVSTNPQTIGTGGVEVQSFSTAKKGNYLYILTTLIGGNPTIYIYDTISNQVWYSYLDANQTGFNGCSIIINEETSEIYAAWASKNSTLTGNFNIRYIKGNINLDGSVIWGTVEQVTKQNASGRDYINPSFIITSDSIPIIFVESGEIYTSSTTVGAGKAILALKRNRVLTYTSGNIDSNWSGATIYSETNLLYIQAVPSAIFVPKSINGLNNGRAWVSWEGIDSVNTTYANIHVAYSDDSGANWTHIKLTTTNDTNPTDYGKFMPSMTVNKNNKVFIVYYGNIGGSVGLWRLESDGNNLNWTKIFYSSGSQRPQPHPSTLIDFNLDFSLPLFIYTDSTNSKVGLYGTWQINGNMSGIATKIISPADVKKWNTLFFDKFIQPNTNIICDILDTNDSVLKSNVKSAEDISSINVNNTTIKIRFTLSRTNGSDLTPTLNDFSIIWEGDGYIKDETTNKKYKYIVSDGQLYLEEVR